MLLFVSVSREFCSNNIVLRTHNITFKQWLWSLWRLVKLNFMLWFCATHAGSKLFPVGWWGKLIRLDRLYVLLVCCSLWYFSSLLSDLPVSTCSSSIIKIGNSQPELPKSYSLTFHGVFLEMLSQYSGHTIIFMVGFLTYQLVVCSYVTSYSIHLYCIISVQFSQ